MKRSSGLRRRSPIQRGGTPLKKANPERQKKSSDRQRKKHQAYMRSETRTLVEARSEGRCECIIRPDAMSLTQFEPFRCLNEATDHHHVTYARYGGSELPSDVLHVCEAHHDYLEAQKPAGNRYSRSRNR